MSLSISNYYVSDVDEQQQQQEQDEEAAAAAVVDEAAYQAAAAALDIVLSRQIAGGNFSHVYYGTSPALGEVCVKFLKPVRTARDESFRNKNFEREVTLMRLLKHPNIMELLAWQIDPFMVIVTKYMAGGSLFHLIHHGNLEDAFPFVKILRDICCAMSYLHTHDPPVLHRDLSSPNVLIDADLSAHVADFGLAKCNERALLPSGQRGNLPWLAPETLDQCAMEPSSDVYSFGIILWEVLTKQVPFAGCSRQEIANAKRSARLPGATPDTLAPEFCTLVARCLHVNPLLRPSFVQLQLCFKQLVEQIELVVPATAANSCAPAAATAAAATTTS